LRLAILHFALTLSKINHNYGRRMKLLWVIFCAIVTTGLCVDLIAISRQAECGSSVRHAKLWLAITVLFAVLTAFVLDFSSAMKFFTGYLLELSLSVDNLFVFTATFSAFNITGVAQQKALFFGIIGAIFLRLTFITMGIALFSKFPWLSYVFGAMVMVSAIGLFRNGGAAKTHNLARKFVEYNGKASAGSGAKFFMKRGSSYRATPFLICIVVIELADIAFAADSVPVILSITNEPILVFSSNIFAVIGLRSLYAWLSNLSEKFHLLRYGVAICLLLVGAKMLLMQTYHVPTGISLAAVLSILILSILASRHTVWHGGGNSILK
jgi:tellurite resistance protein TerC